MKTIIAGTRTFYNYSVIEEACKKLPFQITEVISGCASGADEWGEFYAERHNIAVKRFKADWKKHGRAAGPIRNSEMAAYADALVAFWDGESRGTKDMINKAKRRGLTVVIVEYK